MSARTTLSKLLNVTEPRALELLAHGLVAASQRQRFLADLYAPAVTFKEYAANIERLQKGLEKIASGRGDTDRAIRVVRQAISALPPADVEALDSYDRNTAIKPLAKRHLRDSHFEQAIDRLIEQDDSERRASARSLAEIVAQVELNRPGKGGGSRCAKRFVPAIQELAYWFAEALPNHAISSSENTVFYRYVAYWLQDHGGSTIEFPERHIHAAIEDAKHWRKISL
ncbi:hypothetical protein [Pseudazoarcus pumilus]|uniref:Uncharacterized protein n=1 Tax=Pseudazoarcus pumilus TaxID=2067960 RepID=A0A2I6S6E2_9RHOO|nr:hypothetical protein [Pseudazoarcus pumilus]AUN94820.1 hypothetical protein C0099_07670 [Pseudazoarcus pumilus]